MAGKKAVRLDSSQSPKLFLSFHSSRIRFGLDWIMRYGESTSHCSLAVVGLLYGPMTLGIQRIAWWNRCRVRLVGAGLFHSIYSVHRRHGVTMTYCPLRPAIATPSQRDMMSQKLFILRS